MEVTIKNIGYKVGTVGWLAKGLKTGELFIVEGLIKNSDEHALFLKSKDGKRSVYLASKNQFCSGYPGTYKETPYQINQSEPWPNYSSACIETLKAVAQDWCDQCNKAFEQGEPIEIKVIRTEG